MKVGFISDELTQDIALAAEVGRALDAPGLEIRSVWGKPPHELSTEELGEIGRIVADQGCEVIGYCCAVGKEPMPDGEVQVTACADRLARQIERSVRLAAPMIRIFPFLRAGEPDPVRAGHALGRVLSRVEATAVSVLVETGTPTNAPSLSHLGRCRDVLMDYGIRLDALWDPGNTAFAGYASESAADELDAGFGMVRHIHVKDPLRSEGYVEVGTGAVGWPAVVGKLSQLGYEGWLSLETHWRLGRVLTAQERLEPWGYGFSDAAFEPTVRCLLAVKRMIDHAR